MAGFNMYEAIAKSHNDAHPDGPYVTSVDVRQELHRLLEVYGKFKNLQGANQDSEHIFCSFCHSSYSQAQGFIIGGPGGVYICYTCVDRCREIISEVRATTRSTE